MVKIFNTHYLYKNNEEIKTEDFLEEFFTFMMKAVIIFSVFWYFGVNFFKHSHEISAWLQKRKLNKLAKEHKDRVVDLSKIYKEQFGFLESAEYIKERVKEIKKSLSDNNECSSEVKVNALEFIFLINELNTDVLKTDRGIYIVSRKNINDLLIEQEKDTVYYAKKMREYALNFLPKDGEPISLNADEVLYWVRNGMLRRPKAGESNKVFSLSSGLREVCLDLREDFVSEHYALTIVSHADFIRIKERRVDFEKKEQQKMILTPTNTLVEGQLELFSDNTRRMKLGDKVIVYDSTGKSWLENLKGERIDDAPKLSNGKNNTSLGSSGLSANDFVEKESHGIIQEVDKDNVEVKLPPFRINQNFVDKINNSDIAVQDNQVNIDFEIQKKEEEMSRCVMDQNLSTIDSFFEYLKDPHAKTFLRQKIYERGFPFGFIRYEEGVYVSVKSLLEITADYLSDSALEIFALEVSGGGRSITDYNLDRFYSKLEELKILLFSSYFRRSDFISFKRDGKRYSIRVVEIAPSFCVGLDIEEGAKIDIKANARKGGDVYIDFSEEIIDGVQTSIELCKRDINRNPSARKEGKVEVSGGLREERSVWNNKKEATSNLSKSTPKKAQKKKIEDLSDDGDGGETISETKTETMAISIPKPKPKKQIHNEESEKRQLKQKMKRETFLKKFCTVDRLFSEKVFDKGQKDCDQFYYTFRMNPGDNKEAWLFFSQERFKNLLYPFLEKEKIEFNQSNKFLNSFLIDDLKGDLSRRYIYTVPDGSVFVGKLVKINVPIEMLDGLRLDIGYRGGYREAELKKALEIAKETGDTSLTTELQALIDAIHRKRFTELERSSG